MKNFRKPFKKFILFHQVRAFRNTNTFTLGTIFAQQINVKKKLTRKRTFLILGREKGTFVTELKQREMFIN